MKKLGLIGYPISHSLSPYLFREAYKKNPAVSNHYTYDLIERQSFDEAMSLIERENYWGVNVTSPFKEDAYRHCADCDDVSKKIGAVNLMISTHNGYFGYNTDYWAVVIKLNELTEIVYKNRKPKVLIIGSGGAGRAAALASSNCGYDTYIANRTPEKYKELLNYGTIANIDFTSLNDYFRLCGIIIYTIPVPLPPSALSDISLSKKVIIESNYKKPAIAFYLENSSIGSFTYISGKEWLYLQALKGFEIFTGEMPDITAMKESLIL